MSALTSCCRRGGEALPRDVYANDTAANSQYVNNRISNNKYTVWSFIPKNLMEQFRCAAAPSPRTFTLLHIREKAT